MNILILYSMAPTTPAYRVITDEIRKVLNEKYGDGFYLYMEYLETERFPGETHLLRKFNEINQKYASANPDLVIGIGVGIVPLIRNYASQELLALPYIIIDFDFSEYGINKDLNLSTKCTIIPLTLNIDAILNSALALFPDRTHVYFISGISKVDKIYFESTKIASSRFNASKHYEFISDISMDEALDYVKKLPGNSIVFVTGFNVDSKNVQYYNPESIRLISRASALPVFAYSDMGFGDGSVGGYVISFQKIGRLAADIVIRIAGGTDPASIVVTEKDIYENVYDWRQLKRFGLDDSPLIPQHSRILYKQENFLDQYRYLFIAGTLFLLLQSLLIINLVRLNRRHKRTTGLLLETEKKYHELIHEDRVLRLGQLTASLSHELNQPLTAILSTAQAGLRFVDSGNYNKDLLKELFGNIVEDDKRTASILSSIRGMLRLEKRDKEKVNLNVLIIEIMNIFKSLSVQKGIKIESFLMDRDICIQADPIQIQQVVMNLVLNAMQASEKASGKNKKVTISELIEEGQVTVLIRDYGPGIDAKMKDKLFKPFISSKKEGTGIGLAISRSIIEDHQGVIWAENAPDKGAVFAFKLMMCDG
ncbi:MAG: sensor histidine kinase [Bacteroidales bacterium]|nr:sensor histidine kinase [Bacteroidales bacterium]